MLNLKDVERDLDKLQRSQAVLNQIVQEANALGVFLVDTDGFLVAEAGEIDLDRVALAALIAASFGATAEIASLLGEQDFNRLTHQGKDRHLFIGKAGERHILIVVFGGETNLGLVKLYTEQAADHLGRFFEGKETGDQDQDTSTGEAGDESGSDDDSEDSGEGMFPAWLDG